MISDVVCVITGACAYIASGRIVDPIIKVLYKDSGLVSKIGSKLIGYTIKSIIAAHVGTMCKTTCEATKMVLKKKIESSSKKDSENNEEKGCSGSCGQCDDISEEDKKVIYNDKDFFEKWLEEFNSKKDEKTDSTEED